MCGGQRGEDLDQLGAFGRRQPGGRFVEQDEARRAGERQRDLELALLAVAQFGDKLILHGGEVDGLHEVLGRIHQRVVAARPQQREAPARNAAAREIHVVDHRKAGEQRGDLIGAAQAPPDALVRREVRHVLAEEADRPGGRREVAGDAVEQRGLAGAVRAEHRAPLARPHGERDVGQCGERAEHPRDAAQLQRVRGADGAEAFGDGDGSGRSERHQCPPCRAAVLR